MMDWDKLRIFHAVADAGSLTHADLRTLSGGYEYTSAVANANDGDGRDPDPSD